MVIGEVRSRTVRAKSNSDLAKALCVNTRSKNQGKSTGHVRTTRAISEQLLDDVHIGLRCCFDEASSFAVVDIRTRIQQINDKGKSGWCS